MGNDANNVACTTIEQLREAFSNLATAVRTYNQLPMYGLCLGQKYNQKWHMSSKAGVAKQIVNCCCPSRDTHETHVSNVLPQRL